MKFKWGNPYEWLSEKTEIWTEEQLKRELLNLARRLDFDELQTEFESDMDLDGYFAPLARAEGKAK